MANNEQIDVLAARIDATEVRLGEFSHLEAMLDVNLGRITESIRSGFPEWAVVLCGIVAESILRGAAEFQDLKVTPKEEGLSGVERMIRQRDHNVDPSKRIIVGTRADRLMPTISKYRNVAIRHTPHDELTLADAQATIERTIELLEWYEELLPEETQEEPIVTFTTGDSG